MNYVADIIRAEIAEYGAISFARFMELALYCPVYGFYEKEKDTIGRAGNFYTSVSVGKLFGEMLAFQFAEWLDAEDKNQKSKVRIVEAGAHDGTLAKDILNWLQLRQPTLFHEIEYCIVEPSARRKALQKETLREHGRQVRWVGALHDLSKMSGIIFSNELLDAMPVRRIGWNAQQREWFEWGVAVKDGEFIWTRMPKVIFDSHFTFCAPPELLAVLPDDFTTEICHAAEKWWREAAGLIEQGKLLTIDYGLNAEEFFLPQRATGTLRAYRQHRFADNILANPGEQDITAHVNFTSIQQAGEAIGLTTETLQTQAKFLASIAERAWRDGSIFGKWTEEQTRQFQTLTHPNHLGQSFRVLIQSR